VNFDRLAGAHVRRIAFVFLAGLPSAILRLVPYHVDLPATIAGSPKPKPRRTENCRCPAR
jgi:hypothetical protein